MTDLSIDQKIELLKFATQLAVAQLSVQIKEQDDNVLNFSGNLDSIYKQMVLLVTKV